MTDYKSLAERIRQTLAEGGDCELTTEEWRVVADLLESEKRTEERTETHSCDCISRQTAIRIASGYCHPANIAAELAKLPSAQSERKTGHWITKPHIYGVSFCSECDFELRIDDTKYCPNCGIKMVEPEKMEVTE